MVLHIYKYYILILLKVQNEDMEQNVNFVTTSPGLPYNIIFLKLIQ